MSPKRRINDEDVTRLLRELPREEPSFDFTARVLAAVDSRSGRGRKRGFALAWALAGLLGLFVTQGYLRERYERSQAAARVRELRDEYRELQTELDKLRALTRELEPVLDLGGTEDVEFVFDLRELARKEAAGSAPATGRATPASAPFETQERRP